MVKVLIAVLAFAPALWQSPQAASEAPSVDWVKYKFENDRFLVSSIDLEVNADGTGKLVFARRGLAKPVDREVRVSESAVHDLFGYLDKLDFVRSSATYQTKSDHSNLGTVTLSSARGGATREVRFNYTDNRDMEALARTLRGVANREIFSFDLETAMRFQPLDTPKLLDAFGQDLRLGNIADAAVLLPLLRQIVDDVSLPLISRNRARDLVAKIEAAKRP